MGFSKEWDDVYKNNLQMSIWPWTDLISLVMRNVPLKSGDRILELGCGAGANIPFLSSFKGVEYCGLDGSEHIVNYLKEKYINRPDITIKCCDFTQDIPFEGKFDLIVDRSSVTHNVESDIRNTILHIKNKLKDEGVFIGIDWHSTCYSFYQYDVEQYDVIDTRTRIYKTGDFAGSGITHFSDADHIRELFCDFDIKVLYEKRYIYSESDNDVRGAWEFVAVKR